MIHLLTEKSWVPTGSKDMAREAPYNTRQQIMIFVCTQSNVLEGETEPLRIISKSNFGGKNSRFKYVAIEDQFRWVRAQMESHGCVCMGQPASKSSFVKIDTATAPMRSPAGRGYIYRERETDKKTNTYVYTYI